MKRNRILSVLGALAALSLANASPVRAQCTPAATTTSVKGTLTGTFYATDGTATKVKCDLTIERDSSGAALFTWSTCPGIDAYGTGVFMIPGASYRTVKKSVDQKSCTVSNRYASDDIRMAFVSIGTVTTSDTAQPATFLKEKGTLSFTRKDGVFSGKYTATYPKP